ncbi:MAG: type II toxin-antitoxin system RelE/ParE family toxin [Planctomycetaceae bacterium]|nr:type II toxin-antitoxin system RelE/ParE family toxin [Planctomycetaceae bacterium]
MKVDIDPAVEPEILAHIEWYDERDRRLGDRLIALVEATFVAIARAPLSFPLMEVEGNPGDIRRVRLKGFPLFVVYQVCPDVANIVAVQHASQLPGYWASRLNR